MKSLESVDWSSFAELADRWERDEDGEWLFDGHPVRRFIAEPLRFHDFQCAQEQ